MCLDGPDLHVGVDTKTGAKCSIRRNDEGAFRKGPHWCPVHNTCTECSDEFRQTLVKFSERTSHESCLLNLLSAPIDASDDAVHVSSSWLRAEKKFIGSVIKSRVRHNAHTLLIVLPGLGCVVQTSAILEL